MNGLLHVSKNVFLDPSEQIDSVTVGLMLFSGSRAEREDRRGAAHTLEHCVTSTVAVGATGLYSFVDSLGGRAEAVTTPEYTIYSATVPRGGLDQTWLLMRSQFLAPDFTSDFVERQKFIVLDEIRGATADPKAVLQTNALFQIFGRSALGYPPRGLTDDIIQLTPKKLKDEHESQLASGGVVVACGAMDVSHTVDLFESTSIFASDNNAEKRYLKSSETVARPGTRRTQVPGRQSHVLVSWVLPDRLPSDDIVLSIVNRIVGGGGSSNLRKHFGAGDGAYSCHTFRSVFSNYALWCAYVSCSHDSIDKAIDTIIRAVEESWNSDLFDQRMIDGTAVALTGAQVIGFESTRMRMNWYSRRLFDGDRLSSDKTVVADSSNTEVTVADVQGLRKRLIGPFITITDGSRGV